MSHFWALALALNKARRWGGGAPALPFHDPTSPTINDFIPLLKNGNKVTARDGE